jgi:hypothetical protein
LQRGARHTLEMERDAINGGHLSKALDRRIDPQGQGGCWVGAMEFYRINRITSEQLLPNFDSSLTSCASVKNHLLFRCTALKR